ncbi:L-lactate permease [Porphyromonas sp. COT-290 OH3588]|uniref:L-lactate permease n=1 Tax=Porphyromonas sp. COT-290 OH3588 TaxID=1515617 RepID=UPI00052DA813|nr:L-lactate permease [Porphyromonas sp. COT-290 OH3588]KGN98850.1 lactate permease [Porphyromonas sp. COT-290 OH3588]
MSIILSLLPIALLIVLMIGFKMRGDRSALCALLAAVVIAIFAVPSMDGFGALPEGFGAIYVWWAFVEGALKAIFPILIIIMMAIYSYNVLLESKQIEVIKQQFTSISSDKRIQVLLIVWGFGGLLEGMAGFGTAVAIPAAILIGLGFKPGFSALVSLIANSVATGFGAVGVPVITLAKEAMGSDVPADVIRIVAGDVVLQLSVLMFMIPFVILFLTDTSRKYIIPNILLTLAVGAISLATQFAAAYWIGAETPAIIGSIACIIFLVIYAKVKEGKKADAPKYTTQELAKAWAVYGFILLFIVLASPLSGPISEFLKTTLVSKIHLPIYAEGKTFNFGWLSNAGLMLFLGAFIGGLIQGVSAGRLFAILGQTVVKLQASAVTIISLVAMSSVMSHSGMILCIANALAEATGALYPLFAPLVGAIGTFATGSDTSSNILFGKLQADVAGQIGMDKAWLAAANTAGATGGKIISPQSIAIATASCNQQGQEGAILRSALPYALVYVLIAGLTVYCFSHLAL